MVADELELRPVEASEVVSFVRSVEVAFGAVPSDEEAAYSESVTEPPKTLAVFDGGRIVATAGWNDYDLTLPAGPGSPQ